MMSVRVEIALAMERDTMGENVSLHISTIMVENKALHFSTSKKWSLLPSFTPLPAQRFLGVCYLLFLFNLITLKPFRYS